MLYLLSLCLDSLCLAYHSCSLSIVLTVRKKGPNRADPVPTKAPESCVAHASDYSIWQEVKALQSALESKIHSNLPACSCIDFLSPLRPCIAAQEKHGLRCSTLFHSKLFPQALEIYLCAYRDAIHPITAILMLFLALSPTLCTLGGTCSLNIV